MFGRVEKALAAEVLFLREQLVRANERCDRLTEALARKNDLQLVMPQTPVQMPAHVGHQPLEKSEQWYGTKYSPVIQKENSGGFAK